MEHVEQIAWNGKPLVYLDNGATTQKPLISIVVMKESVNVRAGWRVSFFICLHADQSTLGVYATHAT